MSRNQVLAAILATLLASGAQASSSVAVNLTNVNTTSTGAFSWLDTGHSFTAMAQDQNGWTTSTSPAWGGWVDDYSYGSGASVSASGGTSASAGLTQNGFGFLLTTPTTGGTAIAALDLWGDFSLAAHSSVTISWDRSALGTNSGQAVSPTAMVFTNSMVLNMSGVMANEWHGLTPLYAAQSIQNPAAFSVSGSDHQSFTFTNSGDATLTSTFRASVQVFTQDAVAAAVPEPESYAMALAGLGIVGFTMARRRRS